MNITQKYFPDSLAGLLVHYSCSNAGINNIYPVSLYEKNHLNIYNGLRSISNIRRKNIKNPILFFSFFPKEYLHSIPEFSVIGLPGIYFIELPFCKATLDGILHGADSICEEELKNTQTYLNLPIGYILLYLKKSDNYSTPKFLNCLKTLYGNSFCGVIIPDDTLKNDEKHKSLIIEMLFRAEIERLFKEFRHGESFDIINKLFGPLNSLTLAYKQGLVDVSMFVNVFKDIIGASESNKILKKLKSLYNNLYYLSLFEESKGSDFLSFLKEIPDAELPKTDSSDMNIDDVIIGIQINIEFLNKLNNIIN